MELIFFGDSAYLMMRIPMGNKKYNIGDRVFIISNGVKVDELTVIAVSGNFYTLRYVELGGGTRLASHRLYATREEAETELRQMNYRRRRL